MNELLHHPITIILALSCLDVVTGVFRAKSQEVFESKIFRRGLITHSLVVVGLGLLSFYAPDFNLTNVVYPIFLGFVLNYIFSILENYRALGGRLPENLDKMLSSKVKEKEDGDD